MSYQWKDNIACKAVYETMSRQDRMNQFDKNLVPFAKAGNYKIADLKYFPRAGDIDERKAAAHGFCDGFLEYLLSDYSVTWEVSGEDIKQIVQEIVDLLSTADKTLTDLAALLDIKFKYADE